MTFQPLTVAQVKQLLVRAVEDRERGLGGRTVHAHDDALEFLVAGARAVQVGTATFYDPTVPVRLLDDLERIVAEEGVDDVNNMVGPLRSNREAARG